MACKSSTSKTTKRDLSNGFVHSNTLQKRGSTQCLETKWAKWWITCICHNGDREALIQRWTLILEDVLVPCVRRRQRQARWSLPGRPVRKGFHWSMFKRSSGEYGASFVKNKFRVISDVHKLINRTHLARRALYPTHVVHEVWLISSQT